MTGARYSSDTRLDTYTSSRSWHRFRSAVSLHAHTHHSREVLSDLPRYIQQIPIVKGCFDRALKAYAEREGCAINFANGWWHPPVSPRAVFDSEAKQIEDRFSLAALVSVTDHDDITAGVELQTLYAQPRAPISFEWTVPIGTGYFHLGVHNLPPASAREWFARLAAVTARPRPDDVASSLHDLSALPGLLVVLNHPMWDLANVGAHEHTRLLREFCTRYRLSLHALEINGYRSWRENERVRPLARELQLPLVSGGDRHGRDPNAVLNVTSATSFAEFAAEVREGVSQVVIMPEYRQHLAMRKLSSASDVLRRYPAYPPGRQRWTDRISWSDQAGTKALSAHWPGGGPLWVRSAVGAFRLVTSPVVLPMIGAALGAADSSALFSAGPDHPSRGVDVLGLGDANAN